MDRQVKQRVVGAAILVVLGVIFIPIFLDDGGLERSVPDVAELPPLPEDDFDARVVPLDESDIAALEERAAAAADPPPELPPELPVPPALEVPPVTPQAPPDADPAPAVSEAEAEPESASATPAPAAPSAGAQQTAALPAPRESLEAWTVQLGSFANHDNARRLIEKLRADGYPAYLERRVDAGSTAFKVRVGPQVRREEAERVRAELADEFELQGMLLRYP